MMYTVCTHFSRNAAAKSFNAILRLYRVSMSALREAFKHQKPDNMNRENHSPTQKPCNKAKKFSLIRE